MTWEELITKSKKLGYRLCEEEIFDGLDYGKFYYLEKYKGKLTFLENGTIETEYGYIIAEDRTYEQMYQIMLALQ